MAEITHVERQVLEEYRDLRISLEELRTLVSARMDFNFRAQSMYTRGINKHVGPAIPGIPIEIRHLEAAYSKWKNGELPMLVPSDWASMLLMNDDYDIADDESDVVAEWLNHAAIGEVGAIIKG